MHTSVLVIGSGPAGYTASIYTSRAGLDTILVSGGVVGGQLTKTHEVENFPGFLKVSGLDLMDNLKAQAENAGTKILYDEVIQLDLSIKPFKFKTKSGVDGLADSVILATGASSKWLNIKGEETFKGNGISICAVCDGFFYRNKKVAVIGGGNTALYEALFLSKIAQEIYLINNKNQLKGEKLLLDKTLSNEKIKIINNSEVVEFKGETKPTALVVKNLKTKKLETIEINGAFEAIGTSPNISLVENQLKITSKGYIKTNKRTMQTSIEGVFACGDVQEDTYKQAIISAGSGAIAALSAEKYLLNLKKG